MDSKINYETTLSFSLDSESKFTIEEITKTNEIISYHTKQILDAKEQAVFNYLVSVGWTPPQQKQTLE